jgi:hypothetical protein
MGVRTTADEKVESALESINNAIQSLSDIVVNQCWGHDSWNVEYRAKLEESFLSLMEIRKKLEGC